MNSTSSTAFGFGGDPTTICYLVIHPVNIACWRINKLLLFILIIILKTPDKLQSVKYSIYYDL